MLFPSFWNENMLCKKLVFRIYGKQALLVKQGILCCKKILKNCISLERHFLAQKHGIKIRLFISMET